MTQRINTIFLLLLIAIFSSWLYGCAGGNSKLKDEDCTNGIDDDKDGRVDCADSDCVLHVACLASTENCTNGIDDDGDDHADCADADCAANVACQPGVENCTNGVDDDGDGRADCTDTDCASHSACQSGGTCTIDDIFFDSPQTCQNGFICGLNAQLQPTCLPSSDFAGGTLYGACGPNGECPKGSACFNDGTTDSCYPFCTDAHPDCPPGGICAYGIEGSDTIFLCAPYDDCDVVGGTTGCPSGQGCYLVSDAGDGLCLTNGTGATGTACTSTLDCRAGNICADPGTGNVCIKLCDSSHPCSSGTCNTNVGLPTGIGACL